MELVLEIIPDLLGISIALGRRIWLGINDLVVGEFNFYNIRDCLQDKANSLLFSRIHLVQFSSIGRGGSIGAYEGSPEAIKLSSGFDLKQPLRVGGLAVQDWDLAQVEFCRRHLAGRGWVKGIRRFAEGV